MTYDLGISYDINTYLPYNGWFLRILDSDYFFGSEYDVLYCLLDDYALAKCFQLALA